MIATANGDAPISPTEVAQLSRSKGRLERPLPTDIGFDKDYGRQFYLRRTSQACRVTIFEGGHEGIATAAMAWFDVHP